MYAFAHGKRGERLHHIMSYHIISRSEAAFRHGRLGNDTYPPFSFSFFFSSLLFSSHLVIGSFEIEMRWCGVLWVWVEGGKERVRYLGSEARGTEQRN